MTLLRGLLSLAALLILVFTVLVVTGVLRGTRRDVVQDFERDGAHYVANDEVEKFVIMSNNGASGVDVCMQAGIVAAAYLQAHDAANYRSWTLTERRVCARAGVPVSDPLVPLSPSRVPCGTENNTGICMEASACKTPGGALRGLCAGPENVVCCIGAQ